MFENIKKDSDYLHKINIKYQLILRGNYLLEINDYSNAVDFYSNLLNHELFIDDYYPYLKLSLAYRGLKDFKSEVKVLKDFINSGRVCDKNKIEEIRQRLKQLDKLSYYNYKEIDELNKLYENNSDVEILFPNASDIKKQFLKKNINEDKFSDFFDEYVKFDRKGSIELLIKFKNKLIINGEDFIKGKDYLKAITFYNKLLTHDLFVNDCYPYIKLLQLYNITNQESFEVKIMLEFFDSSIYCSEKDLKYILDRLHYLSEYGFFNLSKIQDLENYYNKNGAFNKDSSSIPVPSSVKIKNAYKYMDETHSIDENSILEILSDEIPDEYLNKLPNQLSTSDLKENDSKDIFYTDNIDNLNLTERKQMIIVLQVLKAGFSRSNAAKLANCSAHRIYWWFDQGRHKKNANVIYFYVNSNKIEDNKREGIISQGLEINEDLLKNDYLNNETNLISQFNEYIKSPYYKMDLMEFNLTLEEIEDIKNNIIDDILKHNIVGVNVNFKDIFIDYCQNFNENHPKLSDWQFDEIFSSIDVSRYDEKDVLECKLKTIDAYNYNKINKNEISLRFDYYIKRKVRQSNQLSRLDEIKSNPHVPDIKLYLSKKEQDEIYKITEYKILSGHGLNSIVLDYVKFKMNNKVEKNKKEAFEKYNGLDVDFSILNEIQVKNFTRDFEYLINKNKLKTNDITQDFVEKLILQYKNSGKISI